MALKSRHLSSFEGLHGVREGESVDVIVLLPERWTKGRHSVVDVLATAPDPLSFQSADDVDAQIQEAREEWER